MFVCSELDQFRMSFDSETEKGVQHWVTWNHQLQELVCSCQGYTNHDYCWHLKHARDAAECLWVGHHPRKRDGKLSCPICDSKVYEVREYPTRKLSSRSVMEEGIDVDSSLIIKGNFIYIFRDDNLYMLDREDQRDEIHDFLFNDVTDKVKNVPMMTINDARDMASVLSIRM